VKFVVVVPKEIFIPEANGPEAAVVQDIDVLPVRYFDQIVHHLRGTHFIEPRPPAPPVADRRALPDMADVKGQEWVKEALVAAGGHNILLVGPPGSGKTMTPGEGLLAILPPLAIHQRQGLALPRLPERQRGNDNYHDNDNYRGYDHSLALPRPQEAEATTTAATATPNRQRPRQSLALPTCMP